MIMRRGGRILLGGVVLMLSAASIISAGEWRPLKKLTHRDAEAAPIASSDEVPTVGVPPRSLPLVAVPTAPALAPAAPHCGTNFGVQAFPYGYFGAKPCPQTACHHSYHDGWNRSYQGQWNQWTVLRGN